MDHRPSFRFLRIRDEFRQRRNLAACDRLALRIAPLRGRTRGAAPEIRLRVGMMPKRETFPPQMVMRRARFAIALAATFVASAAFAQTTSQWRIDAAKADAAYQQAMEQAAEKR